MGLCGCLTVLHTGQAVKSPVNHTTCDPLARLAMSASGRLYSITTRRYCCASAPSAMRRAAEQCSAHLKCQQVQTGVRDHTFDSEKLQLP